MARPMYFCMVHLVGNTGGSPVNVPAVHLTTVAIKSPAFMKHM